MSGFSAPPGFHRRAAPRLILAAALVAAAAALAGPSAVAPPEPAAAPEKAAARAVDPVPALLQAARARRLRADDLAARAAAAPFDAPPGETATDLLAASARESAACAADGRRAWTALAPAAAQALSAGAAPAGAFKQVPAAGAEPLYLDAVCSASWARAQGFTQLIDRHVELQAELSRVAALAPALDAAGPDRELGRLLAALPAYAGGNLADARTHFEAALARAPGSIATRLLFARGVAVKQQDRALFESQLTAALASVAITPEDHTAQSEARSLLAREDDLFGRPGQP